MFLHRKFLFIVSFIILHQCPLYLFRYTIERLRGSLCISSRQPGDSIFLSAFAMWYAVYGHISANNMELMRKWAGGIFMRASPRCSAPKNVKEGGKEGGYRDISASLSRVSFSFSPLVPPSILSISILSRSEIARRIINNCLYFNEYPLPPPFCSRQTQFLMPHTRNEHLGERILARVQLSRELSTV